MAKDENKESEIRGDEQEIVDQRLPVWRPQDADREYYRYETKKRIQHYTVPPQTIFRPAKPTPTIRDAEHKRVAVYARVSTKSKEQVSSIENQTKYYTEKIAKTPNWDLAEIYSDEGKSGTSKKWRPEFKRMLEDASKKKMDLIVCASVSRFARNISDLIEEVRKLRTTNPSNPVGVYFETEDLYTLDPNINERLQMQGLFAEWESGNKSRRMILSYDQRICTGQFPLSDLLGLRHTIEGGFIIEEEEAKTVKYIFLATLCGYTAEEIAEVLTEKQHYVFTHGWIPSIPNRDKSYSYISSWREADREQWNRARWFNGMDAAQTADENKTIVCGHWHTSYGHSKYEHKGTEFGEDADFSPYYGPGIIAIDACTAFSGKVNCLVIED